MALPSDSFKQFNYSLRPSKQVERKVMIEILLKLAKAGFAVSEYRYLGFGSVYYVDFVMFHKYLFIENMVCVEWGQIERRMRFNKPFKFIKLVLSPLSRYIPRIRLSDRYLVWLDYDRALDEEMLQDIDGVLTRLSRGSIFIITVDARAQLPKGDFDVNDMARDQRERLTAGVYNDWFKRYVGRPITRAAIAGSHVAPLFYEAIVERIKETLDRKEPVLTFIQFFNCFYRDGAPMLTIGGIVGTAEDEVALKRAEILKHKFARTGKEYLEISVPPLTLREKHWLDCRLDRQLTADRLQFELDEELLVNYRNFYKEYPTYLETLL